MHTTSYQRQFGATLARESAHNQHQPSATWATKDEDWQVNQRETQSPRAKARNPCLHEVSCVHGDFNNMSVVTLMGLLKTLVL
jgi:hypothetical protein